MAGNAPQAQRADPVSVMRMVMGHRRVAQSPFSQLQEPGADLLAQPQSPFAQVFKKGTQPLVPNNPGAQEETPGPKAQVGSEAPKAPGPVVRQASYTAPPGPNQGPMPPTPFQDRLGDVTQAIAQGTFDPAGQNFTTFGPDMHGEGHTPGLRFVNAAARSAGVDPQHFTPEKPYMRFEAALEGMPINAPNWDTMVQGTAPSLNVEDRRGELTWRNKPVQQWSETDKADYAQASNDEKNAYLGTMVAGAMGNRENYAPEYQGDPGRTNQEAQQ